MSRLRILHVVAGLTREDGGVAEVVAHLACEASRAGHFVTIATVKKEGDRLVETMSKASQLGVRLLAFPASRPFALRFSRGLLLGLPKAVEESDVVHVHSNWTFPVWCACRAALRLRRPLIMTPHGCLNARRLRVSAWKKRFAGWLFDRRLLRAAAVVHATSQAEANAVAAYVGKEARSRVVVAQCGVDEELLRRAKTAQPTGATRPELSRERTVLYLGRLHPLKGVDLLVDAWARVVKQRSAVQPEGGAPSSARSADGWRLVLCGIDEGGNQARLIAQALACGLRAETPQAVALARTRTEGAPDIIFGGPIYGQEKTDLVASSSLFVLPTYDENFGIVVAEALACGVPVITTKGAPWMELLGETKMGAAASRTAGAPFDSRSVSFSAGGRCGWWVDVGVGPLVDALCEAMSLTDDERQAMGENGKRLVEARYTWPRAAAEMEKVYKQLCMEPNGTSA